ncbi:Nif3-like dinuclear metal center hexameric protein [Luedemannella helvata]|uniref:GTP cyclohydrolase 1 type 2 homolog n=1 Tax=Luedemannella helvata TaxID=349315 RepID=A0ABN2KY96_9ACTN
MMVDAAGTTVADVVAALAGWYPPDWAEDWDRVGLVVGDPAAPVTTALLVVDCVPETVDEAVEVGADLIIAHHPLLLRGVHSVAATTYKGTIVHRLIRADIALLVAHTNADTANPGVSDALAARFRLTDLRPLVADGPNVPGVGTGRVGELPQPLTLAELADLAARRLPATPSGVRAAGDRDRLVSTLAVCGGAGDPFLAAAAASGADAYLTSDLRHHVASEHLAAGGPALLDAAHWAIERPWLDLLAGQLADALPIGTVISDIVTDPWTLHVPAPQ